MSASRSSGPAAAEALCRLRLWGSLQRGLRRAWISVIVCSTHETAGCIHGDAFVGLLRKEVNFAFYSGLLTAFA